MPQTRRSILAGAPAIALGMAGLVTPGVMRRALAADPRMSERALGNPNAKVRVEEWYSMTCTHCARFAADVFPKVREKLIDTGRIYYVFCDYPLDRVALMATMVARSLPVERYEPFVLSLLSSQDRWAYNQDVDPQAQLQKMAALAGMSADQFTATINDEALRQAIMAEEDSATARYKIDSTPTFRFNAIQVSGEISFDTFSANVDKAAA
ncbi:thiol:disulfide interchange protein [Ameyamaea chiangmaiensis NBRC 103196]|uniref:Thioredoxin domain-containing protein n=1 Tax=Ameyamaea chiangmaiensis TaxID=442969 RepID=A0A850PB63_9PROT|nr:thioredoxin domain-containing protein [Ameyamaea chiangmaiensis]MBS4075355.1 thioredoxin domain-containing protein [Ameyamaea chiangmaiensis]NVN41188.1 thioredoxin domain-containing protein [Ameyamaea chiangmaiensis]GBQ70066.1 thiol:disulfide interchange protein [Ameyamaea chiangmaiensis NBRC 103196]